MTHERRQFTRILFSFTAEITANDVNYGTGEILNISLGGCLLECRAELEQGTGCHISMDLSGESSGLNVQIDGVVVRSQPESVVVQFTRIDPDSLFHLQNIIRHHSPDLEAIENEIREHSGDS